MKKIFALFLLLMTGAVFAQNYQGTHQGAQFKQSQEETGSSSVTPVAAEGSRHMLEFNIDSIEALAISFDKIKTSGKDAETESNMDLSLNYAYGVHPFLQAGVRFDYFSGVSGADDQENLQLALGAILNFQEDFTQAFYTSLYLGAGWDQTFGQNASRDDLRTATLSVGKRFSLKAFGMERIVYSPEISYKAVNSTDNDSLDHSKSLQFKIVQFSVFF